MTYDEFMVKLKEILEDNYLFASNMKFAIRQLLEDLEET